MKVKPLGCLNVGKQRRRLSLWQSGTIVLPDVFTIWDSEVLRKLQMRTYVDRYPSFQKDAQIHIFYTSLVYVSECEGKTFL